MKNIIVPVENLINLGNYYFEITGIVFWLTLVIASLGIALGTHKLVKKYSWSDMGKMHKIVVITTMVSALVVAFRKPIALGAMTIVDMIGAKFGLCTIELIDFLNMIYYL